MLGFATTSGDTAAQFPGTLLDSQIPDLWCSILLHCRAGRELSDADLGWSSSAPSTWESVELVRFQWSSSTKNSALFCFTRDEKGVSHGGILCYCIAQLHQKECASLSGRDFLVLIQLLIRCATSKLRVCTAACQTPLSGKSFLISAGFPFVSASSSWALFCVTDPNRFTWL